ncbi:Uncharacterized protein dnl_54480 [Desulfonema limicola]|uniref:HEPN domain-containing protein n=1 Tax=Desulfonema limicola TaxID=45656 RepID=A0A975GIY1_9BACT|nr:hypothetical protein [Desulfonema limicola]QTA83055.1 Uncharacterized protein dnl_54480 [Desulfonema limicola]
MSFDWRNYKILAEYLYKNVNAFPDREACFRALISRAYYSVFCSVRDYIKQTYGISFTKSEHQAIPLYLKKTNDKLQQKIGRQLEGFFDDRVNADYKENWHNKQNIVMTAGKSLKIANDIFKCLDELNSSSKRKKITKPITFKRN